MLFLAAALLCCADCRAADITLAWNASPDPVTGYTVYYGRESVIANPGGATAADAGTALEYTVTGLTAGTRYYFALKASNANGQSDFSNEVTGTAPAAVTTTTTAPPTTSTTSSVSTTTTAAGSTTTVPVTETNDVTGTGLLWYPELQVTADVYAQGTLSTLTVTRIDSAHPQEDAGGQGAAILDRYYIFTPTGSGFSVDICLPYFDDELGDLDESTLHLCRWTGAAWECFDRGAGSRTDDDLVCAEEIAAFSDFVIAGYPAGGATTTTTVAGDSDQDGITDAADNCPGQYNPGQLDGDGDGIGDLCDPAPGCGGCGQPACEELDTDVDGIADAADNCPYVYNPGQLDGDGDGTGDCCAASPGCGGCGQPACDAVCAP